MKHIYLYSSVLFALLLSGCNPHNTSPSDNNTEINEEGGNSFNENGNEQNVIKAHKSKNTFTTPNEEPYFKYQWHLNTTNYQEQNRIFRRALAHEGYDYKRPVVKGADIHIQEAWKLGHGGKGIIVAVIDDGADVTHEDLKANIYKPYNVAKNNSDVSNPFSMHSHGNSCAGFIASPANGIGTMGVAPFAKVMPIKVDTNALESEYIKAFEYAKNNGAKVISCSWGSGHITEALSAELKAIYDANITVLFASGNHGQSEDSAGYNDESESKWVIGVGATGEWNDVTDYSDYGKNIDILAPGGDANEAIGILGIDDRGDKGSQWQYGLVSKDYAFNMGTSFACPIAAGVVALMYEVNPTITPKEVRDILIRTAEKVGGIRAHYVKDPQTGLSFDEKRAYGKINAYEAVKAAKALLLSHTH